ncbi:hypothetical protein Godav_002633 [Gossypium davidsonii]|uniref:Uncharacterized protein n=2 Tax=Gossypium TaxID=3633 RepID=A0A7J8SYF8_GOSDV|nr:hypothetical protein [Gossypium davidsonii]MBA0666256.1 hypothetical protein [Gossypium klotzschianum]
MLHLAFGSIPGPIPFRRNNIKLSCGNMSPHKFKNYSMVKMDIDVCVANATAGVENIGVIARMSEDTQSKEGDFQIAR